MHIVTHSRRMQNNTYEIWESRYGRRLRGPIWMKHGYFLCCTWLCSEFADMQTFETYTFFVMAGFAQTQTHTSSHKERLVFKPWNHTRTCRAFTNHETTAQKTFCAEFMDSWPAHSSMKSRRVPVPHRKAYLWTGRRIFGHCKKSMLGSDSGIVSLLQSLPKPNASNMRTTSVGTKGADPKHQQPC